jgi:HK97 family phage major capsid protein
MKSSIKWLLGIVAAVLLFSSFAMAAGDVSHGVGLAAALSDPSWGYALAGIGSVKLKELRDQRGKLVADARAILNKAEAEKRSATAEESAQFDAMMKQVNDLGDEVRRHESLVEAERDAAAQVERGVASAGGEARGNSADPDVEFRTKAFGKLITSGVRSLNDAEVRALQADSDTAGGFLVAPEQFVSGLIKNIDDMVFIRQRATKFSIPTSASLGAASLAADPADADWTTELATGNEDSTMSFGKRALNPHPLAKRLKVSNKFLRMAAGAEGIVRSRLAYKFGISQEKAFMTGTGVNQPLGVFTASADGITTARDVSTGNTATSVTFDGLINAKYSLKGQYWNRADWMFHRDVLSQIAKLKNGEGEYIWRESVRDGEPDRLLGRPVMMSEYAPNTLTASQYVGILGEFSNYWVADALDFQIQVLNELYAETAQTGFIGRLATDGMPVLAEAFARVKLAA